MPGLRKLSVNGFCSFMCLYAELWCLRVQASYTRVVYAGLRHGGIVCMYVLWHRRVVCMHVLDFCVCMCELCVCVCLCVIIV